MQIENHLSKRPFYVFKKGETYAVRSEYEIVPGLVAECIKDNVDKATFRIIDANSREPLDVTRYNGWVRDYVTDDHVTSEIFIGCSSINTLVESGIDCATSTDIVVDDRHITINASDYLG